MGPRLLLPTSGRIKSRLSPCTRMASASAAVPAQISMKTNDFEDIMSTMPYKAQDTPDTFTDIDGETLRRDGLATFSVDLHDVEDVARMYRRLRLEHSGFRRCRPSAAPTSRLGARANIVWTEEIPFRTEASGFRLTVPAMEREEALAFEVYTTGKVPSPLCWPYLPCMHVRARSNTSKQKRARACTHTHAHTHARKHTHTHTHAHTGTHAHNTHTTRARARADRLDAHDAVGGCRGRADACRHGPPAGPAGEGGRGGGDGGGDAHLLRLLRCGEGTRSRERTRARAYTHKVTIGDWYAFAGPRRSYGGKYISPR
jgi:hypothetical protein